MKILIVGITICIAVLLFYLFHQLIQTIQKIQGQKYEYPRLMRKAKSLIITLMLLSIVFGMLWRI
jgi:uncharacterized Tic20 family protein